MSLFGPYGGKSTLWIIGDFICNLWYHVNPIRFVIINNAVIVLMSFGFYQCSAPFWPQEGINVPTIVSACTAVRPQLVLGMIWAWCPIQMSFHHQSFKCTHVPSAGSIRSNIQWIAHQVESETKTLFSLIPHNIVSQGHTNNSPIMKYKCNCKRDWIYSHFDVKLFCFLCVCVCVFFNLKVVFLIREPFCSICVTLT